MSRRGRERTRPPWKGPRGPRPVLGLVFFSDGTVAEWDAGELQTGCEACAAVELGLRALIRLWFDQHPEDAPGEGVQHGR